MTTFGDALRSFRQASSDPHRHNRRLSQQRLGELIGKEMGDLGFSGAAISDWERGESMINAADRNVLLALIQVLHKTKGLSTLDEANRFLECGNFRILNEQESTRIFGNHDRGSNVAQPESESKISQSDGLILLAAMFSISKEEVDGLLATAKEGPPPGWPRILAAIMRKASDRFSFSLNTVLWIWVWLFTWWLIRASLRLPYANREAAFRALTMYAAGSVMIPLLIGLLVNTNDNKFWKEQNQIKTTLLRLYTYQGSGIGFNVGYFLVFPIALIRYYFHLAPAVGVEILTVTVSLILGNMGARVVPYNLLRAYQRLTIQDGAIFFAVAFIGLFWGFFFFQYYSLFLTPVWGTLVILSALTIAIIVMTRDAKKQKQDKR